MKKRFLFITHETSRTGAPMVMLLFIKWLQDNKPEVLVDVLALKGGSLEADFQANCNTYYNYALSIKKEGMPFAKRILKKLGVYTPLNKKEVFISNVSSIGYDIIYANTIISIPMSIDIKYGSPKSKIIGHIHELEVMIKNMLPNLNCFLPDIEMVIVPAKLVKANLLKNWKIDESQIKVVYECAFKDCSVSKIEKKKETHSFIVGASGTVDWRKGYDLFVLVARYIKAQQPSAVIVFKWVGRLSKQVANIIDEDLNKMGLSDRVTFVGEVENTEDYFNDFDVFLMPSREDPFPLVCIEVGLLGKPIISFDQAVGTNEILKDGGGFIVPYLDVVAMAESVLTYYNNREILERHGTYNKVAFTKFTPEEICPQLYDIIKSI
ncbi:glycosyltransferase involved in cell wall biosynthesis [Mariniflexile fucanivorans]|uniref:Glycosyltransferase involved in cell wall biosynthesis n=1 Tax=Mariniflexile fucanivorans TaxID=264023 RepID=A0A4V2QDI8_9FLAO|nr:glycosyltransferase family 4 protein [Mariniflexile fucanivorans]TCL63877.1 glycosyltransferase involved in cell wall biosynthesis [Mariniflexile fucanivorans]